MKTFRIAAAALLLAGLASADRADAVPVLDDFNAGDVVVTASVPSTFGVPVPGVFGDNRGILLLKEFEASATSVTVGSGVFTFNRTGRDFASLIYGTLTTDVDLSAYNAFRLTIVSAPENAGLLDLRLYYQGSPTGVFGVNAVIPMPSSGTVTVPFSALTLPAGFPPFDLAHVRGVGIELNERALIPGTYVFDDFLAVAVAVPEPSMPLLFAAGLLAFGAVVRRRSAAR
jgi:hypothetical protein